MQILSYLKMAKSTKHIPKQMYALMKKTLDKKSPSLERERAFSQMYKAYIKEYPTGSGWMSVYKEIREKYADQFTPLQLRKFGIAIAEIKKSYMYLQREGGQLLDSTNLDRFLIGYSPTYSLIKKLSKGGEKILEIGYGEYPCFHDY